MRGRKNPNYELSQQQIIKKLEAGEKDFSNYNLEDIDFSGLSLKGCDFSDSMIRNSNFAGATLSKVNFNGTYFERTNFAFAFMARADLSEAVFKACNFQWACVNGAKLIDAAMIDTVLYEASFTAADCSGLTLDYCSLEKADFSESINLNIDQLNFLNIKICPTGKFYGYKKALYCSMTNDKLHFFRDAIIKLEIPEDAKRSNATGRKCRASKAKVISITDRDGNPIGEDKKVFSIHDRTFYYKVGKIIEPTEPFNENPMRECASGIHFFLTREEALYY